MYEFNPDDAFRFAQVVHISAKERGNELFFKNCPFCRGSGRGNERTFSINLTTGQFKCFRASCGRTGNMIDLAREFDGFSLGSEVDEYFNPKKQYKKLPTPKAPIIPKDPAIRYLEGRSISKEVATKYQITCQNKNENVLAMPFFDERGEMCFVKYRNMKHTKDSPGSKEWCEANCKPILYGMYQCNLDNKTLVITEGQMDSLSLVEAGIENAVSVPMGVNNFTWVPYCWNWINKFEKIIVFGDRVGNNITLLADIKRRFKKLIYQVRVEDYKDCKDANDILRKYGAAYLRTCIENAIPAKLDYLIDGADVEPTNIFRAEKLTTGIKQLDDSLYGGFYIPGLTIITGKRGEGKSTYASQVIAGAIRKNYKCFVYSGELDKGVFMSGLIRQIAGPDHIHKYINEGGYPEYTPSNVNITAIREWLRGKVYIYDSTALDEKIGLIEAIENAITRYGTRVILLDNLMTALSLEERSADKYEMQSIFTQRLASLAIQYNVLVLLVAHKKKLVSNDELDDISGSSDIANLCTSAVSYSRDKEIDEDQRLLKLIKTRFFGKVNYDGWVMNYDVKSTRIYGEGDDPNMEYGWYVPEFEPADPTALPFT
jgi:archaellum biogenesis ATPase FlaH